MRKWIPVAALVFLAACAARPSHGPDLQSSELPDAMRAPGQGYLTDDAYDILRVLPPAPIRGDARDDADRRIFRDTRAFKDSPRWQLAHDDADLGTASLLKDFACSLDLQITPEQAPRLVRLLENAMRDTARGAGIAKERYQRLRPFRIDEGATCLPQEPLARSFDYPSGHATAGWTSGLVLAQVAPAHANAVLARGRSIGESRVVCGVHNASSVEAAQLAAGAALALASALPGYRADLDAARAEYARLDRTATSRPDAAACRVEAALVAQPLLPHN
jgi:acid phosphatase (class A)